MNLASSDGGTGLSGNPNLEGSANNSLFSNHYYTTQPGNGSSSAPGGGTRSASVPTQIAASYSNNSSTSSIGSSLNGSQTNLSHPRPNNQQSQSMSGPSPTSAPTSHRPQPPMGHSNQPQFATRNTYSPVRL